MLLDVSIIALFAGAPSGMQCIDSTRMVTRRGMVKHERIFDENRIPLVMIAQGSRGNEADEIDRSPWRPYSLQQRLLDGRCQLHSRTNVRPVVVRRFVQRR